MIEKSKIGNEFEKIVAKLFELKGYKVETNKILIGKSGVSHEIDIYGKLKGTSMAAECKYRTFEEKIGKNDIAIFLMKLDDLNIQEAYMVTNSKFDENAVRIGSYYNIKMIDGDSLKEEFRKYGIRYTFEPIPSSTFLNIIKSFVNLTKQL
jgi:restriction endonuclease Mrr